MKNRSEFGELLLNNNLMKYGAEIGTFKGNFSKEILKSWPGILYMIDVWRPLPKEEYDDISNNENHIDAYKAAMDNTKEYVDRAFMLRMTSQQASALFANHSLDFVYIDANHTYESVLQDIQLWYPKVRIGGIVAGHDFLAIPDYHDGVKDLPIYVWANGDEEHPKYAGMFGVNPAVKKFTESYDERFEVTEEWMGTWWFVKKHWIKIEII